MACDLESNGWRQGSLARTCDIARLLSGLVKHIPNDAELVVVSQSCDLAQGTDIEPYVEAIVAKHIDRLEGNYTFNKNGRTLDVTLKARTEDRGVSEDLHIRLSALQKVSIPKDLFATLSPSEDKVLPAALVSVLADWLGARYSRSAFPTAFNDALMANDRSSKKLRNIAKRMSPHTAALYLELNPDRDLHTGEKYRVNLLALVLASAKEHRNKIELDVGALKALMEDAGMEVSAAVGAEDEVTIAVVKRMRRLHLNDLSLRGNHPLPPRL